MDLAGSAFITVNYILSSQCLHAVYLFCWKKFSILNVFFFLQMDRRKDPSSVDVKKVLLDMREYRMGLIQTPDQLRFSYMAVIEGSKLILKGSSTAQVAPSCLQP